MNFNLGANSDVTIRNSRIGKDCDGQLAGHTTGLLYGIGMNSNVQLMATGNDLSYDGAEPWTPIAGVPTRRSVIANNQGVDNSSGPTYPSASTVTLNLVSPRYHLTGTTAVNTITPAWNGQPICLISDSGAISFGTSGNIAAAVSTSGAYGSVCGYYDATYSKWFLK